MRKFVIISLNDGVNLNENIVKWLPADQEIVVYMRESNKDGNYHREIESYRNENKIKVKFYPNELWTNWSKLKNFVSNDLIQEKTSGFVHVLENTVKIERNPDVFLDKIEKMMTVLGLKSWFNTSCDQCNYVYQKYNPRMCVLIDEDEAKKVYEEMIMWCSNANPLWVCYNMDVCQFEDMRFEERFRFPMYYIIEFLARRRNSKKPGQLDYMNYYPSIRDELGVFKSVKMDEVVNFSDKEIQEEGEIFQKEMKVDNHPDSSVEEVMSDMRNRILEYGKTFSRP